MNNQNNNYAVVVTTISKPNKALKLIAEKSLKEKLDFYVIGDLKSPNEFFLDGCDFYSTERQKSLPFRLAKNLPYNHYTRKNLGYLLAAQAGHEIIVETDDDNIPNNSFFQKRTRDIEAFFAEYEGWVNVYSFFTKSFIWPRGFPLEFLKNKQEITLRKEKKHCPIQQGMANNDPDIDAVYRMTAELPIVFDELDLVLSKNSWCPFNSQNTTWFKEAFLLMYLPSFCSFRMTDIWRSFVAQLIAWTCNWNILFHKPTVYQERNEHNLLVDFKQEIPGYLNNANICDTLSSLDLLSGKENITENLFRCYKSMLKNKWIEDEKELDLLEDWLEDFQKIK